MYTPCSVTHLDRPSWTTYASACEQGPTCWVESLPCTRSPSSILHDFGSLDCAQDIIGDDAETLPSLAKMEYQRHIIGLVLRSGWHRSCSEVRQIFHNVIKGTCPTHAVVLATICNLEYNSEPKAASSTSCDNLAMFCFPFELLFS